MTVWQVLSRGRLVLQEYEQSDGRTALLVLRPLFQELLV